MPYKRSIRRGSIFEDDEGARHSPQGKLGQGDYGIVRAFGPTTDNYCWAVKHDPVPFVDGAPAYREAKHLMRGRPDWRQHGLVKVFLPGRTGWRLVMPFEHGIPLWRIGGSERNKLQLARQLLTTLHRLHSRNIYHCDIHENNIMVTVSTLSGRLIDFGLSQTSTPGSTFARTDHYKDINDLFKAFRDLGWFYLPRVRNPEGFIRSRGQLELLTSQAEIKALNKLPKGTLSDHSKASVKTRPTFRTVLTILFVDYKQILDDTQQKILFDDETLALAVIALARYNLWTPKRHAELQAYETLRRLVAQCDKQEIIITEAVYTALQSTDWTDECVALIESLTLAGIQFNYETLLLIQSNEALRTQLTAKLTAEQPIHSESLEAIALFHGRATDLTEEQIRQLLNQRTAKAMLTWFEDLSIQSEEIDLPAMLAATQASTVFTETLNLLYDSCILLGREDYIKLQKSPTACRAIQALSFDGQVYCTVVDTILGKRNLAEAFIVLTGTVEAREEEVREEEAKEDEPRDDTLTDEESKTDTTSAAQAVPDIRRLLNVWKAAKDFSQPCLDVIVHYGTANKEQLWRDYDWLHRIVMSTAKGWQISGKARFAAEATTEGKLIALMKHASEEPRSRSSIIIQLLRKHHRNINPGNRELVRDLYVEAFLDSHALTTTKVSGITFWRADSLKTHLDAHPGALDADTDDELIINFKRCMRGPTG